MTVDVSQHKNKKYELSPPEGGWGYFITLSISMMFIVTVVPLNAFGMVYGKFLSNLGDEASGTALANGIFNTVLSFTGLAANQLLQKCSCRKVGLIGASFFFIGSIGSIFVTSLFQLIISFGVFEGIGFGLMMPACFTSFNTYFDRKKNTMMSVAQVVIVAVTIGWPSISKYLLELYGFRGTVAIFSALSLHCFVAMGVLQPVKWHMKKTKFLADEEKVLNPRKVNLTEEVPPEMTKMIAENEAAEGAVCIGNGVPSKPRASIGGGDLEQKLSLWQRISKSLDLGLFKDPVYVNIAFGLSLGLTSDLAFLSLLPLLLTNAGFTTSELTFILTVHFTADLVSRILLSILTAVMQVRNRYLFLAGALLSAVFRTAFIMNNSFMYVVCISAALGFLRCFIQTPLPLVVAEVYTQRFATAFSLYMVVCGVVSLVFGLLIGYVKTSTGSDIAVVHVLTAAYLGCGIPWTLELISEKILNRKGRK